MGSSALPLRSAPAAAAAPVRNVFLILPTPIRQNFRRPGRNPSVPSSKAPNWAKPNSLLTLLRIRRQRRRDLRDAAPDDGAIQIEGLWRRASPRRRPVAVKPPCSRGSPSKSSSTASRSWGPTSSDGPDQDLSPVYSSRRRRMGSLCCEKMKEGRMLNWNMVLKIIFAPFKKESIKKPMGLIQFRPTNRGRERWRPWHIGCDHVVLPMPTNSWRNGV
ncbi:uncharacterized protein LOC124696302 [Lolium rigidum]|uniref:uncharacterized protein LOC124696302 n=1 Tax=Lolium rigidum TaxID=89674 RepID=UPI001F5C9CFC|nr:uncharacterized protein LOC124696302 [Lolium rigidum]